MCNVIAVLICIKSKGAKKKNLFAFAPILRKLLVVEGTMYCLSSCLIFFCLIGSLRLIRSAALFVSFRKRLETTYLLCFFCCKTSPSLLGIKIIQECTVS